MKGRKWFVFNIIFSQRIRFLELKHLNASLSTSNLNKSIETAAIRFQNPLPDNEKLLMKQ